MINFTQFYFSFLIISVVSRGFFFLDKFPVSYSSILVILIHKVA